MAFNSIDFTKSTSITDQLTSSTSAAASGFGLNAGSASLSGVVSDIGSKLNNVGISVDSITKLAPKQLGDYSLVSKFKDQFKKPKPIQADDPSKSIGKTTNGPATLMFPSDLGKYYIKFTFFSYEKPNPNEEKKFKTSKIIILPMPGDLVDRFTTNYSGKELGLMGKLAQNAGSGVVANQALAGTLNASSVQDFAKGLGLQVKKENAYAVARTLIRDSSIATAADRATGTTLNPFNALMFEGVSLRKHSFKFRLSPNSQKEVDELKNIILSFKERMLPSKNGLLFDFPDTCVIEFGAATPYSMKTCFLENLTVNYAPTGIPSFFKGGTLTTEVELTLDFGEIEPVTRDDMLANKGNITGTAVAYNSDSSLDSVFAPVKATPVAAAASAKTVVAPLSGVTGVETGGGAFIGSRKIGRR